MPVPISNVTRRAVYAPSGAGGAGPYAFTFEILAATDIAVYKDDVLLTLTTHYTVTINANGTGSVTITAAGLALAPASPTQYAIVGNRTIARTTDFTTGGDFFANTLNDELDQQTIFAQQNSEGLQRALQAPQTDPTSINMTLPRATVRANKTLAFDSSGNPVTGEVIGDNRGNWAAGTAYNKRDIVKDTSNGNIYYANTAHTSSGSQPISTNADSAKWDLIVDNASAGASATAAAASASAAATSASNASTSASNASTSASNAASSASAASTSASNASTSASNAASSATAAAGSASTASTQATNASNSATAAATSASNAASSATSASNSASTATTQAGNASTSATNAANSASSASSSASTATTQAGIATTQATNAATSASNASTSATNAANSATAAASSASSAAASAASAATALDSFDDRYLGTKSSDPTLDNDGNALVAGALYFSTSQNIMKVYDGATWIAATSAGNTSLLRFRYIATAGQTSFSGADSNAATLTYTVNNIVVFLNGVALDQADYTATSGTSVVLTNGAALNDELVIVAFKSFVTADMVPASTGGTYAGAVRFIAGSASVPSISVNGDTNTGIFFPAADTIAFSEGGTEAMRIDSSSNLLVGTTTTGSPGISLSNNYNIGWTQSAGESISNIFRQTSSAATVVANGYRFSSTSNGFASSFSSSYAKCAISCGTVAGAITFYTDTAATVAAGTDVTPTERMRIDPFGSVGIGTSSPAVKLQVKSSAEAFRIEGTTARGSGNIFASFYDPSGRKGYWGYGASDDNLYIANEMNAAMLFITNGSERARIDNGNLLVGTTSGSDRFMVKSAGTSSAASAITIQNSAGTELMRIRNDGVFYTGGATFSPYNNTTASAANLVVGASGDLFRSTSSLKYKQDVADATHGLAELMQLRSVTYKGKSEADGNKVFGGLIAEEVHQAGLTEFVQYAEDGSPDAIAYGNMVSLCIKAIQEQQAIIQSLTARIEALESQP